MSRDTKSLLPSGLLILAAVVAGGLGFYAFRSAALAQPAGLSISADKSSYAPNAPVQVCYHVPAPGSVTITDTPPAGASRLVLQTFETGTGNCLPWTAASQPGQECLLLDYYSSGVTANAQTCFAVVSPATPTPAATPFPTPAPTVNHPPITVILDFPIVTSVSKQTLSPGDAVELDGQGFGAATGQAQLVGSFPGGSLNLQVNNWTAGKVTATVPAVSGVLDQPAQLQLVSSTGVDANSMDVSFVATRETVNMPGSALQMTCPNSTQFDVCTPYSGGTSATLNSVHESYCCFSGVNGTDEYVATLGNGWHVQSVDFQLNNTDAFVYQSICLKDVMSLTSDDLGTASVASAPSTGSAFVDLKVSWHVNANCSPVEYTVSIAVTGPAGVAYAPGVAPGVVIGPPSGHR